MKRKEIYWILGAIVLSIILTFLLFGIHGFTSSDSTLDINIHDTYYVFAYFHLSIIVLILVFFLVYLSRSIRTSFKNLTANLVLMISTIFLILVLMVIGSILDRIVFQYSGQTVYPSLSTVDGIPEIEEEIVKIKNIATMLSNTTLIIQLLLTVLLAYCGFKTGLNYNQREKTHDR